MSAARFFRDIAHQLGTLDARLQSADPLTPDQRAEAIRIARLAKSAITDAADFFEDLDMQAKARRERIEWLNAGKDVHVAKVGRMVFVLRGYVLYRRTDRGEQRLGEVTGINDAKRAVRAWRKAQRKARRA